MPPKGASRTNVSRRSPHLDGKCSIEEKRNGVLRSIRNMQDTGTPGFRTALREIQRGRKTSHWIWYVWPSLHALRPGTSRPFFLLPDLDAARAYLKDEVLLARLREITDLAVAHLQQKVDPRVLFSSSTDATKFEECMSTFALAAAEDLDLETLELCVKALESLPCKGQLEPRVLEAVRGSHRFPGVTVAKELISMVSVSGDFANNTDRESIDLHNSSVAENVTTDAHADSTESLAQVGIQKDVLFEEVQMELSESDDPDGFYENAVVNCFRQFDLDGDGRISLIDLQQVLLDLNPMWTRSLIDELIGSMDINRDGWVTTAEFIQWAFSTDDETRHNFGLVALPQTGTRIATVSKGSSVAVASGLSEDEDDGLPSMASANAEERCRAAVVLHAVGDAMGYKKGDWEFALSTSKILIDLERLTNGKGILALDCDKWMVSDDTVEHLATAEGLTKALTASRSANSFDGIMRSIATELKCAGSDLTARAPGKTEQRGIKLIATDGSNWQAKPFDSNAVGCGAAMRLPCVGLLFRRPDDLPGLVAVAVETCRLTKTHPTGYLGGVCAAAFTAYAFQGIPVALWGLRFLQDAIPVVAEYVRQPGQRHRRENDTALREGAFEKKWCWYLQQRGIDKADGGDAPVPVFPGVYGHGERDTFYAEIARMPGVNPSGKNPGSKGYDSVLIAYDALLWVETQLPPRESDSNRWAELCHRAILHRGDNDSTGSIAAAWYGALHGFAGVPSKHYAGVEYRGRCDACGRVLNRLYRELSEGGSQALPASLYRYEPLGIKPTSS